MTDADLEAIRNTIANENDIVLLRFALFQLLNKVPLRHETLERLDPIAVPAFTKGEENSARGQAGNPNLGVNGMRSLAQGVYRGLEQLDEQIDRARRRKP